MILPKGARGARELLRNGDQLAHYRFLCKVTNRVELSNRCLPMSTVTRYFLLFANTLYYYVKIGYRLKWRKDWNSMAGLDRSRS